MSVATLSQPHSPTPLDYVNPNPDNPFNPEPSHEPEGNPVDDNGNLHSSDGPDSVRNFCGPLQHVITRGDRGVTGHENCVF